MGSWLINECIKKYLHHCHDYNSRKDKENYNDDDDDIQLPTQKKRKKNSINYITNFHEKKK